MSKVTIYDTMYSRAIELDKLANKAIPFLVKNYDVIKLKDDAHRLIQPSRTMVRSAMMDIFNRVYELRLLDRYFFINLAGVTNFPEILGMDDLPVDGKLLTNIPRSEIAKYWVNLTPVLASKQPSISMLLFSNIPRLQELVVRGALLMSYHDSDAWLMPRHAGFVIESYSMAVALLLQRLYNLNPLEYKFVQTIFAVYYAQLMGPTTGPFDYPPLLRQVPELGSDMEIKERLSFIQERLTDGTRLTASDVCTTLANMDSSAPGALKLKSLNVNNLIRLFSAGVTDNMVMLNAFEFPPLWVYQILRVLSGSKNPTVSNLLKIGKMNMKAKVFAEELIRSPNFLNAIGR